MNTAGTLRKLRTQARVAAESRGHMMTRFTMVQQRRYDGTFSYIGDSVCKTCNAGVVIRTHPAPNQIDIGGTAVAFGCPALESDV